MALAEANAEMSPVLLTFATAGVPAAAICPTPCAAATATALVAGVPLVVPWALAVALTSIVPALVTKAVAVLPRNRELPNALP